MQNAQIAIAISGIVGMGLCLMLIAYRYQPLVKRRTDDQSQGGGGTTTNSTTSGDDGYAHETQSHDSWGDGCSDSGDSGGGDGGGGGD